MARRVPVVALTGHLGAGKTTVLNHLLRQPGARVGVVINDFGAINVDAALVTGQIDEPVSIAGGCVCCLLDDTSLDDALGTLAQPRLALDVIVVEASGVAEPAALGALIRHSSVKAIRPAGVVEVVDAAEYFATVDTGDTAPQRFAAASLVVINKCDRIAGGDAELDRIEARIRTSHPDVHVVRTSAGRLDPALVFDVARADDGPDQLPFGDEPSMAHQHPHAQSVSAETSGAIDPGRLIDLLEAPPLGTYRIKGQVAVRGSGDRVQRCTVNVVGRSIHLTTSTGSHTDSFLVAIGYELDVEAARAQLELALSPAEGPSAAGYRRLQRYRRLSA